MLKALGFKKQNRFVVGAFALILLWAVFTLTNLTRIPIAWVDEVMDLDPAFRWVTGQGYNSKLWYYQGTDSVFAANLPLRNLSFIFSVSLAGPDIFWVRLPSFLFALAFAYFAFVLFRKSLQNNTWAALLLLFLLFDKGFYESLRAVRSEMLQVFLLSWTLYLSFQNKFHWVYFLLCGLLFWIHPSMWFIALVLSVYGLLQPFSPNKRFNALLMLILPAVCVFALIDYTAFLTQLFAAGKDHSTINLSIWQQLKGHFITRFSVSFPSQIWQWIVLIIAHFTAGLLLIKTKGKHLIAWLFLGTSLYWFFLLAPHYRYNPPLLFLGFLIFADWLKTQNVFKKNEGFKWGYTLFIFHSLPVLAIIFLGITQRQARDPYAVQTWLQNQLPQDEKFLLSGEVIGAYTLMNQYGNTLGTYCVPIYPHKFPLDSFNTYYVFTSENLTNMLSEEIKPKNTYKIPPHPLPIFQRLHTQSGSLHYGNMCLYELTKEQMRSYLNVGD